MASDAFMEVATGDVWGESLDEKMTGRTWGAFEIASFSFKKERGLTKDEEAKEEQKRKAAAAELLRSARQQGNSSGTPGTTPAGEQKETEKPTFTIKKPIDTSSPNLFRVFVSKEPIKWAVVSFRKAGGASNKPWLIFEFFDLYIGDLDWSVDPEAKEEAFNSQETLDFEFGSMRIKYIQQTDTGDYSAEQPAEYNFKKPNEAVPAVSKNF